MLNKKLILVALLFCVPDMVRAQDTLPNDNGIATYHTAPRYRESESHPLRVVAYILHPIGWVAREVIFRPLSYFASSTETRRSVMGFREPFDYRQPECFSPDDSAPDCRSTLPFNYDSGDKGLDEAPAPVEAERQVYFPNVNFDFDKRGLNSLGKGRVRQIAQLLGNDVNVHVVLQGHTDYFGSEKYNEKLGLDRAEAVKKALIEEGVSADRLSTVTFGESQPLFTEQEDWARAINRRVEVHPDQCEVAAEAVDEGGAAAQ
jgi:outer membrane protein OmpA-like peptidoglycan-associated protein